MRLGLTDAFLITIKYRVLFICQNITEGNEPLRVSHIVTKTPLSKDGHPTRGNSCGQILNVYDSPINHSGRASK